jgi:signal transduction histidine kinase
MATATRELAAGDYKVRVTVRTDDEVGRLGRAFNDMADSLERLDHLRRSTVSDVAHELRTPLTTVRGYLEGLAMESCRHLKKRSRCCGRKFFALFASSRTFINSPRPKRLALGSHENPLPSPR